VEEATTRVTQRSLEAHWSEVAAEGSPIIGGPERPITVVEFGDYQCPPCRLFQERADAELASHSGVTLLFRHLPNPRVHPHSERAALAAICAEFQGRFPAMHALLFAVADWARAPDWSDLATQAGVPDVPAFEACLDGDPARHRLQRDQAVALTLAVPGTPTFVTAEFIRTGIPPEGWLEGLDPSRPR